MPLLCFKFLAKVKEERGPKTVVVVVCSLFCFFFLGGGGGWGGVLLPMRGVSFESRVCAFALPSRLPCAENRDY